MTKRLTNEQLHAVAQSFTAQSIEAAAVNEAITLRAENARLATVLKPFARYAALLPKAVPDHMPMKADITGSGDLTVAHIRSAADALSNEQLYRILELEYNGSLTYRALGECLSLRSRVAQLEEALKPFADIAAQKDAEEYPKPDDSYESIVMKHFRAAHAAMKGVPQ